MLLNELFEVSQDLVSRYKSAAIKDADKAIAAKAAGTIGRAEYERKMTKRGRGTAAAQRRLTPQGTRLDLTPYGDAIQRDYDRYRTDEQGMAEDSLNEFAPGSGGGESGRWYTDDQMTDIVGDGWWQDLDVSGDIPKQAMIQEAQAWLDDQGYNVQVLNCKLNDDDMEWYIEGSFQNSNFAKKGVAEGADDKEPFDYAKWKASTVKPRKPRGYKDAEALGKAIDSEQSELRKRKEQGMAEGRTK